MSATTMPTAAERPDLTIVIASVNGWHVLEPTLRSIDALPERPRVEVIVVEALGGATRRELRDQFPDISVVESPRLAIPRLRYQGVVRSRGRIVAILEDHARLASDWATNLLRAHEDDWGAVGGPVENGRGGPLNWAVYFCEYASYMGPLPEGETNDLPGNNIAFKRPLLMRHARVLDEGRWESWINDRLRADGVRIAACNGMVAHHIKPFRLGYFLAQRFHFARSYAGMRRADQSWPRRLVYGLGSTALPALLSIRVARTVIAKRRHLSRFAAVSPLILLFLTVGAVGEMIGYLAGPGRSLDRVE